MAKKVVDLTIRLKDGVTGVLAKIGGSLKRMSGGFKFLAKAGVAATTAIAGGLVALAKAYADQESVNNRLKASFDAAGESGARAVVKWGAFATKIQRVTTYGDEEIMSLIQLGKSMGLANDKIEEATTGALGLSKAYGIDLAGAMKMTALALQGEYMMLQRYLPELRQATTEAEKQEIVQRSMARGFKMAKAELQSVSGQFKALKGVIGDAFQAMGRGLFGDGGLVRGIEAVKNKIIELESSGAIARWAAQAKSAMDAVVETAKIIAKGGRGRSEMLGAIGQVIVQSFKAAAITAAEILAKHAPKIGMSIGKGVLDLVGIKTKTPEIKAAEKEVKALEGAARRADKNRGKYPEGTAERLAEKWQQAVDKLDALEKAWAAGEIDIGTADLEGALANVAEVIRKYGDSSAPNRKKLAAEMGLRVQKGSEKGTKKGAQDALDVDTPTTDIKDSVSKGLDGRTPEGSANFIKTLMRGQEGLSRRESLGAMRELLKSGGSGQLEEAAKVFKELTKGQTGLEGGQALRVIRELIRGEGLGEGDDTTDLIKQLTKGQDGLSREDASRALVELYGPQGADGLGGAGVSTPAAADPSTIANGYLKTIAENTAGGLF